MHEGHKLLKLVGMLHSSECGALIFSMEIGRKGQRSLVRRKHSYS